MEQLDDLVSESPDNHYLGVITAEILLAFSSLDKALGLALQSQASPDNEVKFKSHNVAGRIYAAQSRFDLAVENYKAALAVVPQEFKGLESEIGSIYMDQGLAQYHMFELVSAMDSFREGMTLIVSPIVRLMESCARDDYNSNSKNHSLNGVFEVIMPGPTAQHMFIADNKSQNALLHMTDTQSMNAKIPDTTSLLTDEKSSVGDIDSSLVNGDWILKTPLFKKINGLIPYTEIASELFSVSNVILHDEDEILNSSDVKEMMMLPYTLMGDMIERAVDTSEMERKGNHQLLADFYQFIAFTRSANQDFDEALKLYNQALEIKLEALGELQLDLANIEECIGITCCRLGKQSEAFDHIRKSLSIRKKALCRHSFGEASCYFNFAMVHNERGEHDQALLHIREALQIILKVLWDNHRFTAIAYHRMYLAN
mgnify:CR=1 FL=1